MPPWDLTDSERLTRLAELERIARVEERQADFAKQQDRHEQAMWGTQREGDDGFVGLVRRLEQKIDRLSWWIVTGLGGVIGVQAVLNLLLGH